MNSTGLDARHGRHSARAHRLTVRTGGRSSACITRRAPALLEVGVLAMMLWDDIGGLTWTERAGPRAAIAAADSRPRRRGRPRRISRSRSAAPGPQGVVSPQGPR